jgi:predicted NBD/HSP70 family sugar kinase
LGLVAGFPGPVSSDGLMVGPLNNVSGMRHEQYDLRAQLTAADSAVDGVIEEGFVLLAVNDGTLAAQAAASRIGKHQYGKTGAVIVGTGVGGGVVIRDLGYSTVHRVDTNPLEIGHMLLSTNPFDSFEGRYSGPGMKRRYGRDPEDLPASHPAWPEEGDAIGRLALTLGLMNEVELVVPTGGVGAGASSKLREHLRRFTDTIVKQGNGPQNLFMPDIQLVPPAEAKKFEMYGAEGVMRDRLTTVQL